LKHTRHSTDSVGEFARIFTQSFTEAINHSFIHFNHIADSVQCLPPCRTDLTLFILLCISLQCKLHGVLPDLLAFNGITLSMCGSYISRLQRNMGLILYEVLLETTYCLYRVITNICINVTSCDVRQ